MSNNLPVPRKSREERFSEAVGFALADGHAIPDVVKVLVPKKNFRNDPKKLSKQRRLMRAKIRRMASQDETVRRIVAESVTGKMVAALPEITDALIKRAKRGRPDAIKLIFEATGYYNPKIQHEHSGDIKITLDIPRPARVSDDLSGDDDQPPVDAEVVEEPAEIDEGEAA